MAQAAFFVNDLKVIDKGDCVVLQARRQCKHGHAIDQVFLTIPSELKHLFAEFGQAGEQAAEPTDTDQPQPQPKPKPKNVWQNRINSLFEQDN